MFSLTLMSKGEKRCGLDATVGDLSRIVQSSGFPSMPKGEIVGMFTGRVCLSLMERTTMTMACLQARVCLSLMARSECASMEKQEQRKLR
jgi:hypothetical protein